MNAPRKARIKPLSFEERQGIGVMGQELYEYLLNFKKDQYREMQQDGSLIPYLRKYGMELDDMVIELMQQDGSLLPYLQKMGDELNDMVIELMQQGLDEAGAKELARAEFNPDAGGW